MQTSNADENPVQLLSSPKSSVSDTSDSLEIAQFISKHGIHRVLSVLSSQWDLIAASSQDRATQSASKGHEEFASRAAAVSRATCEAVSGPTRAAHTIHITIIQSSRVCKGMQVQQLIDQAHVMEWSTLCSPRRGTVPISIRLPPVSPHELVCSSWAEVYDMQTKSPDSLGTNVSADFPRWRLRATIHLEGVDTAVDFAREVVQIADSRSAGGRGILAYEWRNELSYSQGCQFVIKADRDKLQPVDLPSGQTSLFKAKFRFVVVLQFTPFHASGSSGDPSVTLQLPRVVDTCASGDDAVQPQWLCFASERSLRDRGVKKAKHQAAAGLADLSHAEFGPQIDPS